MRRILDRVYGAAAWAAALFMIGTLVMILLSVTGRLLDFHVRGTDAYAGYCMAAAAFLALAHTLKRGEHIRVTLVLEHVSPSVRSVLERVAVTIAAALAGYLAWHFCKLAWVSWQLDERSSGLIALPIWIPQGAMAFGAVAFLAAVAERAVRVWGGAAVEAQHGDVEVGRADR